MPPQTSERKKKKLELDVVAAKIKEDEGRKRGGGKRVLICVLWA